MFNSIEKTLLEKLSRDKGWDIIHTQEGGSLHLGSARHEWNIVISPGNESENFFLDTHARFHADLKEKYTLDMRDNLLVISGLDILGNILKRVSELATSLPNTPFEAFENIVTQEIHDKNIKDSECISQVKQRVGQKLYRKAQEEYWQGCCAVTGVSIRQVLKASHAKPWAQCNTYVERLSVYNGFLLSANLDALFDKGLITFDNEGKILIADNVSQGDRVLLGLSDELKLRWINKDHIPFLNWHRENLFRTV